MFALCEGVQRRVAPTEPKGNRGAGNRNRTYDLRITNALLYQLSYTGKPRAVYRNIMPTAAQLSTSRCSDQIVDD